MALCGWRSPVSPTAAAFSSTREPLPRRASASAAATPPMPPPMMRISGRVLALTGRDSTSPPRLVAGGRATMIVMRYEHDSASFAWKASSFKNPADYLVELTSGDRGEMRAALESLERSGRLSPVHALTKADFRFHGLRKKLERGYAEVRSGKGFVVLRGLPFEGLSLEQFTACAWGVGLSFGRALSQNAQGELVTSVIDATAEDATPRMYRSNLELRPHSDITAMILLACWNKSQSGGASIIVSGVSVHDAIRERAPELLEPLYRGFHYVPKEFNLFRTNGVPRQEGRRASFDFAKLYRDDPVASGGVPDLKVSDSEATEGR